MSGKAKWADKTFALKKLDDFIKNNNFSLVGIADCGSWNHIKVM